MTQREKNRRLYLTGACAVGFELLLCILGYMQMLDGWTVLVGALVCAVIAVYAYRLRECEKEKEILNGQLAQEQTRLRLVQAQLEQERKDAAKQLEQERAASHRALLQMQVECEERNEAFFSHVSHELRLPVSVAIGYAELLRDGVIEETEEQREYLGKIADKLKYMNELIGRNLQKVRDGEADLSEGLQKVSFDLVDFLQKNLGDLRAAAQEKDIDCQLVTLVPAMPVLADPILMQHILDNLVENAMKYMGRPGTVTFLLAYGENEVVLTYRDDGFGMDNAQTAHIFENGFRGSNTQRLSGSGRGLHLVNIIVHAHGGRCEAESAPGMGMRIVLHLPIGKPQSENI